MRFLNTYEVDDARRRYANHPVLGPATATLVSLRDAADSNSDGWAFWPKPARSAAKLMELIAGDGTSRYYYGERDDATVAKLKAALTPIKAFRTRTGWSFDIFEDLKDISRGREL